MVIIVKINVVLVDLESNVSLCHLCLERMFAKGLENMFHFVDLDEVA